MLASNKIKEKLIDKIRNTEDEELLSQISRLIDFESQSESVYYLNDGELKAVNEELNQLSKGEFLSNDEANAEADKWLKR